MSINFIPNDPLVTAPPIRKVAARPDRPARRIGFKVAGTQSQAQYDPGTPGFLRWQARQAAILAVETWEKVLGTNLTSWAADAANPTKLPLIPDAGDDLNAYYNRASVSFFHHAVNGSTIFSGESTDVVSHECGHAVLDAARPSFWSANFLEVGSFHEAFGDVTAIITALGDKATRVAVLSASPDLGKKNVVEATAEALSKAVKDLLGPTHPASKPREALNKFKWQLPSTLPTNGGPDVMIAEVHSMARIISGCFWDTLRGVFAAGNDSTEAGLWKATATTGKIFYAGAGTAPVVPRFFQAIGRAMVLADGQQNKGKYRQVISDAFAGHGLALGANAMLAPAVALAGSAPVIDGSQDLTLAAATSRDLRQRLNVPRGVTLSLVATGLADDVAKVRYQAPVSLDDVDSRLAGVVAMADMSVLVGGSGGQAAVLGSLPHPDDNADAVRTFVSSLLAHDQVELPSTNGRSTKKAPKNAYAGPTTHAVRSRGRTRTLDRIAFACSCGCAERH